MRERSEGLERHRGEGRRCGIDVRDRGERRGEGRVERRR
jgi:hypothetical protein